MRIGALRFLYNFGCRRYACFVAGVNDARKRRGGPTLTAGVNIKAVCAIVQRSQWFGGKILKISPEGKLLHTFAVAAGDGTTNVAFGPGGKELYVTVVKDPNDPQARGSIVRIPNVE
jgi:hypothetical protein